MLMEEKKTSGTIKFLRVLLVVSILILFPIISFLFLWEGVEDRKAQLQKMQDLGQLTAPVFLTLQGEELPADSLLGKVVIAAAPESDPMVLRGRMDSLLQQFGASEDFRFLLLIPEELESEWFAYAPAEGSRKETVITAHKPQRFLPLPVAEREDELPANCTDAACPYLLLLDRSGNLRQVADPRSNEDMVNLVKQIAILIARPKTFEKPVVVREKEK